MKTLILCRGTLGKALYKIFILFGIATELISDFNEFVEYHTVIKNRRLFRRDPVTGYLEEEYGVIIVDLSSNEQEMNCRQLRMNGLTNPVIDMQPALTEFKKGFAIQSWNGNLLDLIEKTRFPKFIDIQQLFACSKEYLENLLKHDLPKVAKWPEQSNGDPLKILGSQINDEKIRSELEFYVNHFDDPNEAKESVKSLFFGGKNV